MTDDVPGRAVRVLLSGYYGYGNLGDEALLAGLLAGLREHGLEPLVLSGDPAGTRRLHGVDAAHRYGALLPAMARSAAVVSGGGGLLQDATSGRSLGYYLGVIRLARALRRTTIVYGQSIGPLSDAGRARVARALRGVPLAVRDAPSLRLLDALGLHAEHVADPALLLRPPTAASAAGPVLLVPRAGHDDLNEALVATGRRLRASGLEVALLALHQREDAAALARLAEALGVAAWHAGTPAEAVAQVARAGYVVSARLHGLVFAAAAGVGFAGLVYDPKVAGFLEDAGAPAFHRPVDVEALTTLAAARPAPEPGRLASLRQRASRGLEWLVDHIRS